MYRIIFNPKLGAWQIQLKNGLLFWAIICVPSDEPVTKEGTFSTYDEAAAFVEEKGLSKVYKDWNDRPQAAIMQSRHSYA